ncbi:glycosyltransferase family 39 protein [Sporolactobacillus shoreicorticis]|uniref:Glycosyltransferase family 39 protein n=1 Tax=Sporolactobacillus shoreicorticis TaxID=1923877 RepID=A0ABW5S219_9BACL|nr:glycosyltransferase family 39 protein [Sporolactobacillus shoreicorticis]MCO7127508.1 glycosyltransferase family 39 protein [Sporolactobacillus shoreicorticis]
MNRKIFPTFFSLVLIICLLIGILGNLTKYTGVAVLIVTIFAFSCIRLLAPTINSLPFRRIKWGIGIGLGFMLVAQIFIMSVMPNTVYHDPYRVLSQADQMAAGHMTWDITYFWRYANNVPLAFLLSLWLRLTQLIGFSTNLSIHLLSLIVLDGFIGLFLWTIYQLNQRNSTLIGAFAFFALTPFAYTYYLQVFYSDLPSMLILLIVIRALWQWSGKIRRQRIISGIVLVVTVLIGELLKPNLIVLIPALAIVAVILLHKHLLKQMKLTLPMLLIMIGFGLSVPATQGIYHLSNFTPETKFEFPVTNWMLMGVNPVHNGSYAGSDVSHAIALPNKAARQKYDLKHIPRRIKKLGVAGMVRLWTIKLKTLLDVRGIQNWYNGGFQSAPAWYHRHAQFLQVLTMISYSAATICLWLMLILRLAVWHPDLTDVRNVATLTAIITALGYLAFHTLLWEVEPRYGQAILPLTWFALAALPAPAKTEKSRFSLHRWVTALVVTVTALASIGLSNQLGLEHPKNTVIAAQRSQLSVQYHAKAVEVIPGTIMTEDIDLHGQANYLSVQIHANSHVRITLISTSTGHVYHLYHAAYVYRLHHKLTPGRYRIMVNNPSGRNQKVDIVRTYHYQLSTHPLSINGVSYRNASFVYTCLFRY